MIEEEIIKAKTLHERYGEEILNDNDLMMLMENYRKAIAGSHELMKETGIIKRCTTCADNEKAGSCCFQGVEEWYDHILLFINLMLGFEITTDHNILNGCLFVGKKGCGLFARHAFCVNYICPSLNSFITNTQKENLKLVTGKELHSGWEFEKSIRNWVRVYGNQGYS